VGQANLVLDADAAEGNNPPASLSAAVRVGNTLLLGGDEGACLDRLTYDGSTWTGHQRLPLSDCLDLDGAREADIEGLAEDMDGFGCWGLMLELGPRSARASETRSIWIASATSGILGPGPARTAAARCRSAQQRHLPPGEARWRTPCWTGEADEAWQCACQAARI
jgi:hypothetical protein